MTLRSLDRFRNRVTRTVPLKQTGIDVVCEECAFKKSEDTTEREWVVMKTLVHVHDDGQHTCRESRFLVHADCLQLALSQPD